MMTSYKAAARAKREQMAYDKGRVFEVSDQYHTRFKHIFECPNTLYYRQLFERVLLEKAKGGRVLDVGCGPGGSAQYLKLGASYVLGVDISHAFIQRAKKFEQKGRLEFRRHNIEKPLEGQFDLIVGKAILHHVDYRQVLKQLYQNNLAAGGRMLFMEPLGENLLIKLFYRLAPGAHTPDERPFYRSDLIWLTNQFPDISILPFNYFSLVLGALSSLIFASPNNWLLRISDKLDRWVVRNFSFLRPRCRAAIFIIQKPDEDSQD